MRLAGASLIFTLLFLLSEPDLEACCPAPRFGVPVVNADQDVIIIWDAPNKTQHFIRRASFKGDGSDFGFLIPSPTQPELSESGNEAFPQLQKLTEPETVTRPRPMSFGCGLAQAPPTALGGMAWSAVKVLDEKTVAGFNAAVLEAKSVTALVQWLKDHDYAYSPEIEAWAKPYIEQGWKITALKVAKDKEAKSVAASALRMSFKTERPLFPYREPDYKGINEKLGVDKRLLRIYFIADARYEGELTKAQSWTGKVAWSGKLKANDRAKLLENLKLPEATLPGQWWLTEFWDNWSYQLAPADVYFTRAAKQDAVKRPPFIQYVSNRYPTDVTLCALAVAAFAPALVGRLRRRWAS